MTERRRRILLLPVISILWNQLVYCGGGLIARDLPHVHMGLWVDALVPFLPWTVSIYFGCFPLWAAVYLFLAGGDKQMAYRFFCADFLAKGVCLAFFVLLPTTMPRPAVPGITLWDSLMCFLYRIDRPCNLFPSIHCLVSWLCLIGVRRRGDTPRALVWATGLGAVLVCLSTLTTRQHVAADVAGGILLAEVSYLAAGRPGLLSPVSRWLDHVTEG